MSFFSSIIILLMYIYCTAMSVCSKMFPDKWDYIRPWFIIIPTLFLPYILYRYYKQEGWKIGRRNYVLLCLGAVLLMLALFMGGSYLVTGSFF